MVPNKCCLFNLKNFVLMYNSVLIGKVYISDFNRLEKVFLVPANIPDDAYVATLRSTVGPLFGLQFQLIKLLFLKVR